MTNSRANAHKSWMVRCLSLALWDFSRSNKHCIQLSTTNTIYISRFITAILHFRNNHPGLFCKKVILKNFPKFIGLFSGTRVSCEFCNNLMSTFFDRTPVAANKLAAKTWISLVFFYGGTKDFIFTGIFLRIITFFIKI